MPTSPFLALPGELRNRIYELCVEPKPIKLPRMPKKMEKSYAHVHWGLYGCLRNVCKQTRAEFGPIYMARTVLVIHQVTANTFLKSFYHDPRRQRVPANEQLQSSHLTDKLGASTTTGNIQIITYFGLRWDATLLVRLCAKYPALKVTLNEASACLRLAPTVKDFFTSISSGAFRPRGFQRIEITCSTLPDIRFTFQNERAMEDMMKRVGELDPRQSVIKSGAPAMDAFAILFAAASGGMYKHSAPRF
jgi:hypothetical protein